MTDVPEQSSKSLAPDDRAQHILTDTRALVEETQLAWALKSFLATHSAC